MTRVTISRILVLPHEFAEIDVDRLLESSWSEDTSDISADGLLVPEEADESWVDVIIEAEVDPAFIDKESSDKQQNAIPWEKEILLAPGSSIQINGVWRWENASRTKGRKIAGHPIEGCIIGPLPSPGGPE